jgi:hypothetical protein
VSVDERESVLSRWVASASLRARRDAALQRAGPAPEHGGILLHRRNLQRLATELGGAVGE